MVSSSLQGAIFAEKWCPLLGENHAPTKEPVTNHRCLFLADLCDSAKQPPQSVNEGSVKIGC
jgi:hypothetical protein